MHLNRIILTATLCLTLAIYIILIASMPARLRHGAFDFIAFYTAGVIVREHSPQAIYNLETQRTIQSELMGGNDFIDGGMLPFNHIPVVAWLASLPAALPFETAYLAWLAIMTVCLLGATICLSPLLPGLAWPERILLMGGLMLQYPLFTSLLKGQDTALLVLGLALAAWGFQKQHSWLLSIGLALLWIKPHYAIVFTLLLLVKRHAASWHIIATALVFAIINVLLVGYQGILDFLAVLRLTGTTENSGMNPIAMINLVGLALRILPISLADLQISRWLIYAAGILLLLWRWWRTGATLANLGLTAALAPLIVPHAHVHDLAFLILGWLILSSWLIELGRVIHGLWLPIAASLFLFVLSLTNETLFLNASVLVACLTALVLLIQNSK